MGITAKTVLDVMRSWLGFNETDGTFKEIIDLYNSHAPLARGYKVKYTDEWCDTCVSAAAIKAGAVDLIGTECGCGGHIAIFKEKGIWLEDGAIVPKPGYIVLYNWDDGTQANDGGADHIGYVESVSANEIICIEGNRKLSVARRTIPIGWGYIRGFACPKYDEESEDEEMDAQKFKELYLKMRAELQDNDDSAYSEEARNWAIANGLIKGGGMLSDGTPNYMWEDIPSREQLITLFYRFAVIIGKA